MEGSFVKPEFSEVQQYFLTKVADKEISNTLAIKFYNFYDRNNWMIKISAKKYAPMKNWKLTINTWIRNLPKYNKVESIKLSSNKIFNDN